MEIDDPAMLANIFWLTDHGYTIVDISKPLWYDESKKTDEFELRKFADGTPMHTFFGTHKDVLIKAMCWLVEQGIIDPNEPLKDEWKAGAALYLKGGYLEKTYGLKPI